MPRGSQNLTTTKMLHSRSSGCVLNIQGTKYKFSQNTTQKGNE